MLGLLSKVIIKALGGTRNERVVRARMKFIQGQVNPLEDEIRALSDEQMLARSLELKRRRQDGESRDSLMAEAFALVRESSRRGLNIRHFDVQLVAGMILDHGWIAEEATGEGKTYSCYPAIYMAWLDGMKVHVVTVNDYLVQRDAGSASAAFARLGLTVGFITNDMPAWGGSEERRKAYECDVTYGTNSEFGFDYLRNNMKNSVAEQVQGRLDFAIVDEVDNILIDEARTPLIISGPAFGDTDRYRKADAVAREVIARNRGWDRANQRVEALKRTIKALAGEVSKGDADETVRKKLDQAEKDLVDAEARLAQEVKHYEIELDKRAAHLTHEGVQAAQDIAGVGSFYVGANMEWPHLMEQALRAHLVFERDKDYVVQQDEVIIVDEFTGRLMEGRQWSDGLHQAVEAKEHVRVKEETQTLATITLQNFFKLYKKLAGMTGTAMTEAGEFLKIYKLDVVSVPTHRPINRVDYNDRIYADTDAKFDALVEEINKVSKAGRPVLVGTTSIEKSEKLSTMLTRRYGIEHQVLNARPENAAREADIVAEAGLQRPIKQGSKQLVGTVTIATNMAGRGTDIKLGPGVVWDKCKMVSREKLAELGVEEEDLFPPGNPGATKCCIHCPQYDEATNCAHCFKPKIDPDFPRRGREQCPLDVPCGLHIVGTERHEARRIDNQLRGRSGRQGDPGSSRFFLSLRDELLSIFAGEWTVKVLGWLGLSGDQAIEDRRISKGIERAQRKVEERNFETRKNLLEYDEVMDYQRRAFYSQRQKLLEGVELEGMVYEMIRESVERAVEDYLGPMYPKRCIATWARQNLQIELREEQVKATGPEDLPDLQANLRDRAKEEALQNISNTLGEYIDPDIDSKDWDLRGLSAWAMSRFNVNLPQNQLRRMSQQEMEAELSKAAVEKIDLIDLSGLAPYLAEDFGRNSLAEWARNKFIVQVSPAELTGEIPEVRARLMEKVQQAYHRREIEYPVEFALEMTLGQGGPDNVYALTALATWANRKYDLNLTADDLAKMKLDEIRLKLMGESEQWLGGAKLDQLIHDRLGAAPGVEQAVEFARQRFDTELKPQDFDSDVIGRLKVFGRRFLRREMNELERFVLLHIYDSSWKDHLLAMDHLKSAIGLRGYAEQDPKVSYKREGSRMFQEMMAGVRDKVTDMIFKVRLAPGAQMSSVYQVSSQVHEQLAGYDHLAQDMQSQAQQTDTKPVKPIIRETPRVGRNDPCPCGSGKKFKKCHGKDVV
ncbi:MAG: preprotein translocase subunit SecA [Phycisphaerae bacterium]